MTNKKKKVYLTSRVSFKLKKKKKKKSTGWGSSIVSIPLNNL